jgi:hypothetical protein
MRLALLFLARHAEGLSDGTISAHGLGIDLLTVDSVPTRLGPLHLVANFRFPSTDEGQHAVDIDLRLPDGTIKTVASSLVLENDPSKNVAGLERSAGLIAVIGLELQQVGRHEFILRIDGIELGRLPFLVRIDPSKAPAPTPG